MTVVLLVVLAVLAVVSLVAGMHLMTGRGPVTWFVGWCQVANAANLFELILKVLRSYRGE